MATPSNFTNFLRTTKRAITPKKQVPTPLGSLLGTAARMPAKKKVPMPTLPGSQALRSLLGPTRPPPVTRPGEQGYVPPVSGPPTGGGLPITVVPRDQWTPGLNQPPPPVTPTGTGGVDPALLAQVGAAQGVGGAQTGEGFLPTFRTDVIPRNPEVLLADILGPGFETNPLFNLTAPLANDIGALLMLSQGPLGPTGADANVDWMRNFFQQMMTPGGALPDLPQLWQNMVNAAAPGVDPLTNLITGWTQVQDPTQQVQNVNSLIAAMADAGMHPLMAQAMLNAVGAAGVGWLGQFGQNPAAAGDSFTNYLAGRGFDFR